MNNLDKQYFELLRSILDTGVEKKTRNGKVLSVFGRQIRHNMEEGFPLLTSKKMYWEGIKTELLWFLSGSSDLRTLVNKGNMIWVGDAHKRYLDSFSPGLRQTGPSQEEFVERIKRSDEFNFEWGNLGPIYGQQWRNWGGRSSYNHILGLERVMKKGTDQIKSLLRTLKKDPDSRRMIVTAWNPDDLEEMVLPPCHYSFQVYTRELSESERFNWYYRKNESKIGLNHDRILQELDKENVPTRGISLLWNQRSVDTPLGLPFNIASYGLLLEMLADEVNMVPLELIGSLGDTHIYENQIEGVREQLSRKTHPLPTVHVRDGIWSTGEEDILLLNYVSEDKIHFPLSN